MVDSIPTELLELQNRFETWRASRQHLRASIPDELRRATLEMSRRYPPSLIKRALKVDPARLKRALSAKRSAPRAAALKKKSQPALPARPGLPKPQSKAPRAQAAALPPPAFFKLPPGAALPLDSPSAYTPAPCRLQLERSDGSRLSLTWPGLDASFINSLVADFLRGGRL